MIGRKMYEVLDLRELQGPAGILLDNVTYQQQQEYMNKGKVPEAILLTRYQWDSIVSYYEGLEAQDQGPYTASLFGSPVWVTP